jgi:nucleotidyltransferase substrate binding protein (TIGR01987 family)
MKNPKIELGFSKLSRALTSLEDIASKPQQEDRSNIDASIQRFEFTIELFWKLLRAILESKGVEVQYPKDVLREAFKGHLIDHEQEWLKMLLDRNIIVNSGEFGARSDGATPISSRRATSDNVPNFSSIDYTSHTYDQQLADKIYNNIRSYIPILRSTFDSLNFLKDSII